MRSDAAVPGFPVTLPLCGKMLQKPPLPVPAGLVLQGEIGNGLKMVQRILKQWL